ncbi:MAG: cytochrome c, class [Rhizobacter sp.]|nr:cytochrome c, class [Rhizobacter sp.]
MTRAVGRRLGRVAAGTGLLVLVVSLAIAARLATFTSPRTQRFVVSDEEVTVPADAASIERGRHLAASVAACTICHGENLGGRLAFDHPLLGRGYTPNLTSGRGGIGNTFGTRDWVRALRHGVAPDGRGLLFMPAAHYRHLNDADLGALIAYFHSLAPVDNERTALELSALARLMIDLGLSGEVVQATLIDHAAPPAPSLPPASMASTGAYLTQIGGCTFCHGPGLTGGRGLEPGAPLGPDLTRGRLAGASGHAAYLAAMRRGVAADGHPIDPRFMPWQAYRSMTDDELTAIWVHLQGLAAAPGSPANASNAASPPKGLAKH